MRILVVEDDPALGRDLTQSLTHAGYAVDRAADGEEAHYLGSVERFDAVVLDLGLPRRDGLSVLKDWRAEGLSMPVVILTARDHWHDKVEGIDAGADDYLAKPFRMEELLARLRAVIRRSAGHSGGLLSCGAVTLDPRAAEARLNGRQVPLTSHEYRVLAYLMHHAGKVVSRAELTEHVYAADADRDSNTIEVFVGRLRKKLGAEAITTVRGLGYRMDGSSTNGSP